MFFTKHGTKEAFGQSELDWIFSHSSRGPLHGKTILETVEITIPSPDALVVMKCISCRINDIRDIFMLMPRVRDKKMVKEEIAKRTNFKEVFSRIKKEILSEKLRNSLQDVFGYIDTTVFQKHTNAVLELEES